MSVASDDADSVQARRAAVTLQIQAETGIDEAMIDRLIRAFYARVREDALLGPVFAERIEEWEPHLRKMFAFWSSVALMSGRYHGQPMARHLPLPRAPARTSRRKSSRNSRSRP